MLITVTAEITVPHQKVRFANVKPSCSITMEATENEIPDLQRLVNQYVSDHAKSLMNLECFDEA